MPDYRYLGTVADPFGYFVKGQFDNNPCGHSVKGQFDGVFSKHAAKDQFMFQL